MIKSPMQLVDCHPTDNQQTNHIIDNTIKNLSEILIKYLPINDGRIIGSSISKSIRLLILNDHTYKPNHPTLNKVFC